MTSNTSPPTPEGVFAARYKKLVLLFYAFTAGVIALGLVVAQQPIVFVTDMQAMLPKQQVSSVQQRAADRLASQFSNNFILLLSHPDLVTLDAAASSLAATLARSEYIELVADAGLENDNQAFAHLLASHRFTLLSQSQKDALLENPQTLLEQAQRLYYGFGNFSALPLTEDPLQVFGQYLLTQLEPPLDATPGQGFLQLSPQSGDDYHALIIARLPGGAFDLDAQQTVLSLLDAWQADPGQGINPLPVYRAGPLFHAAEAANSARWEISVIGTGSMLGIIALFIACFRSLRPLAAAGASLLYGGLSAFIVCHWIYGSVHMLTLVFGASLLGVAIDYSIHYFTRAYTRGEGQSLNALGSIFRGLLLALASSVIGYACLLQAPIESLKQIAVFSVTGLAGAWIFAVCNYPRLVKMRHGTIPAKLTMLAQLPSRCWQYLGPGRGGAILAILTLLAIGVVTTQFETSKSVRTLHKPSAALLSSEAHIQSIFQPFAPNQYFIATANSEQQLLRVLEQFKPVLDEQIRQGNIKQYRNLANYLPSQQTQQSNYSLMQSTLYGEGGRAYAFMQQLGFADTARNALAASFQVARGTYLKPADWLLLAPPDQRMLWFNNPDGSYSSLVLLRGVANPELLQNSVAKNDPIIFVDSIAQLSQLLHANLVSAGAMLALAYLAIAMLLLARVRDGRVLWLLCVPMLSTLLALASLLLAGHAINLFHVFAFYLVLGLGMDYAIFLYESTPAETDTAVAVLLSAITSCLSFGLLSLSSTPMISAFGLAILLGVIANVLIAPMLVSMARRRS